MLVEALKKLNPKMWDRIEKVLRAEDGSLRSLALLGGLNPASDFQGITLAGITLAGQDVRGFDFTGADLRGCELRKSIKDETTIVNGAILDREDQAALFPGSLSIAKTFRRRIPRADDLF